MWSSRRGFTLVEGLFALFLVSLVLSGIAHTLSQSLKIKGDTKHLDQTMEDYHTLQRVQSDIRGSYTVLEPDEGELSGKLVLRTIDNRLSYLERSRTPGGAASDPYESEETMEITYQVTDGYLVRTVQRGASGPILSKLRGVLDFKVSRTSTDGGLLTIEFVRESGRVRKKRILKVTPRPTR